MTSVSRRVAVAVAFVFFVARVAHGSHETTSPRGMPVSEASPAADTSRRPSPPAQNGVEQAKAGVREIFATEFAAATNAEAKAGLAKTLLAEARKSKDPEDVWALLAEAVRLAVEASDVPLMGEGIDALAARFTFDPLPMRLESLTKAAGRVHAPAAEAAAKVALELTRAFADRDDYQSATKAAALATGLAKKSKVQAAIAQAQQAHIQLREQEKQAKEIAQLVSKYRADPADSEARLALGAHLCFKAGEWEKGLPLLAKGGEPDLSAAAAADLRAGQDVPKCLAAAERWERWADGQKVAAHKAGARDRARELYSRTLDRLEGLERTRVQKRMSSLGAGGGPLAKVKDGPRSISGLFMWLDVADPATLVVAKGRATRGVGRWKDLSGNGNDVIQPADDKQPEFRDGGVAFGGSAVLTGVAPLHANAITLLAVFDIDPTSKDVNACVVSTENAMTHGWVLDKHAGFVEFRVFGGAKGRTELSCGTIPDSGACVALATAKESGGVTAQFAGGAVANSADGGFMIESPLPIHIGTRSGTWNFPPFRGRVYRVVLYSRCLEPDEIKSLLEWNDRSRVR